ncbi:MAG: molecular chaperone [Desulfovibrionales bacterium]
MNLPDETCPADELLQTLALLVEIFWGPPPSECRAMFSEQIPHLADTLQVRSLGWADPLRKMTLLIGPDDAKSCDRLEASYVSLFVTSPTSSLVPPYASCHLENDTFMGSATLAMQKRLHDAGLSLSGPSNEPPDHVAIQCEYLYFLLQEGISGRPELLRKAAAFTRESMLPWVHRFRDSLAEQVQNCPSEARIFLLAVDVLLGVLDSVDTLSMD